LGASVIVSNLSDWRAIALVFLSCVTCHRSPSQQTVATLSSADRAAAGDDPAAHRTLLRAKFDSALDAFRKESVDAVWAPKMAGIIQSSLHRHLSPIDGVQLGTVECRSHTCSEELAVDPQSDQQDFAKVSKKISAWVMKDIRDAQVGAVGLELMTRPVNHDELAVGRYYWRFRSAGAAGASQ